MPEKSRALLKFLAARSLEIIDAASLQKKLASGRALGVKLGVDPTTPDLHLGHVVALRILRAFQDAGHRAILIIGDFTGQIGDPAGTAATRQPLSPAEVKANQRTYRSQIGKIIDLPRVEVRHNTEWYGRMRLAEFLTLLSNFSLQSAWAREDFQKRLAARGEVRLHEAMYPVLQAYDSVMVRADVEIGALDQKLNILAGRELQRKLGLKPPPQDAVLLPYLIGTDGRSKMSKSVGNTINLTDGAEEMFGKVMSIPDALMIHYAALAAWLPPARVREFERALTQGKNPRDVKLDVAEAVAALYHGSRQARASRERFFQIFSRREVAASLPVVRLPHRVYSPLSLLSLLRVAASRSEARRLLRGRAVEVDGRVIAPADAAIPIHRGSIIRVGKKLFFRVR